MPQPSDAELLTRVVRMLDPRATLHNTWTLRGGISSRMTVLEYTVGGDLRRVVLRQPDGALRENPRAVANEFALLRSLSAFGLPSPQPRLLCESSALFGAPFLLIEFIDGAPFFGKAIEPDPIRQLAARLVQIHRTPFAGSALESLPRYVPRFAHQRGRSYPDPLLRGAAISDVLNRSWTPRTANAPTLLHGDYWPGNVLWNGGRLVGVVDWEECCIGDPLADLAIARLEMLWTFGLDAMLAFTRRYAALSGFDLEELPYWDLDAALRPVFNLGEWAAGWPELGRPDVTAATMRDAHRTFVDMAFEALSQERR